MPRPAFVYTRISEDREGAGLGVKRQQEDCEALAEELGLEVVEVFTDNDVSAYSGKVRKGYRAMMARLQEADVVLCWHTDRLHRSPAELEDYIAATESAGVATKTVKAGDLNLNTSHGRLAARQLGSLARYESEHKAERIQRKMQELVLNGKWTGGARPFGWQVVDGSLVLDKFEAGIVRDAVDRVLTGGTLASIIRQLEELGVKTTRGNAWSYATLRQMLLRPRNAGLSEREGSTIAKLEADPIIPEDKFRALQRLLTDPQRRKSRSNRARWLLSGIAECHCGEVVRKVSISGAKGAVHDTYRCPAKGVGHVGKRVSFVDARVEDVAVGVLAGIEYRRESSPDLSTARTSIETKLRDLDRREDELARGAASLEMSLVLKMGEALRGERQGLSAQLADIALAESRPLYHEEQLDVEALTRAEATWAAWDIDERRAFVRHHLRVRLLPQPRGERRRFVAETVDVRLWNGGLPISGSDWRHAQVEDGDA